MSHHVVSVACAPGLRLGVQAFQHNLSKVQRPGFASLKLDLHYKIKSESQATAKSRSQATAKARSKARALLASADLIYVDVINFSARLTAGRARFYVFTLES